MTDLSRSAPATFLPAARRSLTLARDRLLVFVAILGVWQEAGYLGVSEIWISSPSAVGQRLFALAASGELFLHAQRTLSEASLGLAVAFAVGVSTSRSARWMLRPRSPWDANFSASGRNTGVR